MSEIFTTLADSSLPHPREVVKDITPSDLKGTSLVFINMPLREGAKPNVTPEGPLLMATNLRDNYGVKVSIIDLNAYRIKDELAEKRGLPNGRHLTHDEAFSLIKKHFLVHGEPDVIGFSGKITTRRWQGEVAKMIRQILPDVFLVSGGGLASNLKGGVFRYIPELDAVAHSEGDDVIFKIVYDAKMVKELGWKRAIQSGKLQPYYLGEVAGHHRLIYAGNRPINLDILPFADLEFLRSDVFGNPILEWYLGVPAWSRSANNSSATPWEDSEVVPKTTSVSSRGCPFRCRYCNRQSQGETLWGVRSAQHVFKELQQRVEKYGIKFHAFPDDNFAVTPQRIYDLVPLLGPLGVIWGTHTRLDEAAGLWKNHSTGELYYEDPLRVKKMAEAGCRYIGFGPESASRKVLEALGKGGHTLSNGYTSVLVGGKKHDFPRSMVDGILKTLDAGIHSNCTWIFASPTETLEDVKETVLFMLWQEEVYKNRGLPPESVNKRMFTLTWYPGTTMINYERVRRQLSHVFGLSFVPTPRNVSGVEFEPVCDEAFDKYLLELDDATKVLEAPNGEPLNFGDMPTDQFLEAREYIDSGKIFKILEM